MRTKGFWYLATPYSAYPDGPEAAYIRACERAAALIAAGVTVFCPIAHSHPIARHGALPGGGAHDVWLAVDEPFLQAARGLIVAADMPGAYFSTGVTHEIGVMAQAGKPGVHWTSERTAEDIARIIGDLEARQERAAS